jgi:hypothetical protein
METRVTQIVVDAPDGRHSRAATAEDHAGWAIIAGTIYAVRVSRSGALVNAQEPADGLVPHYAGVPEMHETREGAEAALAAIYEACHHRWSMLSHEERQCQRCGAVDCIPDL